MIRPAFSIVIPTFNRRATVCDALAAIGRIDYAGPIEVIVVDDGSHDGTAEAVAAVVMPFPLKVIRQANAGAAAARNRGAGEATGDIVLFLDDDMICAPDIVEQHARSHLEGADAVLGAIPLDPASPPGPLRSAVDQWAQQRTERLRQGAELTLFDLLTGQLSVRRAVFEQLGGFDGAFTAGGSFGNEDLDLGVRLLERFSVRFNADAVSWQRYVVTPRQHMRQWRQAGEADVRFALKHPGQAAALFALHEGDSRRVRLVLRPLARVPGVRHWLPALGVAMIERIGGGQSLLQRLALRLFVAARGVAYWAGVEARGGMARGRGVLVLCYHAVADLSGDAVLADYGMAPERLVAQIDGLIRRGFTFVAPEAVRAALEDDAPLPRRAVLLTFDDCYADLLPAARAILQPRGIRGIAFAVAGQTGGENAWDRALGAGRLALLDAQGLKDLAAAGVEVGCHSDTHRVMPGLVAAALAQETGGAADRLAALGLPRPRFFAYPYGEVDRTAREAVRRAGFVAAFGLRRARARRGGDRYVLPRVEILARDAGLRFAIKTRWPALARLIR